jgi:hypothetical protein
MADNTQTPTNIYSNLEVEEAKVMSGEDTAIVIVYTQDMLCDDILDFMALLCEDEDGAKISKFFRIVLAKGGYQTGQNVFLATNAVYEKLYDAGFRPYSNDMALTGDEHWLSEEFLAKLNEGRKRKDHITADMLTELGVDKWHVSGTWKAEDGQEPKLVVPLPRNWSMTEAEEFLEELISDGQAFGLLPDGTDFEVNSATRASRDVHSGTAYITLPISKAGEGDDVWWDNVDMWRCFVNGIECPNTPNRFLLTVKLWRNFDNEKAAGGRRGKKTDKKGWTTIGHGRGNGRKGHRNRRDDYSDDGEDPYSDDGSVSRRNRFHHRGRGNRRDARNNRGQEDRRARSVRKGAGVKMQKAPQKESYAAKAVATPNVGKIAQQAAAVATKTANAANQEVIATLQSQNAALQAQNAQIMAMLQGFMASQQQTATAPVPAPTVEVGAVGTVPGVAPVSPITPPAVQLMSGPSGMPTGTAAAPEVTTVATGATGAGLVSLNTQTDGSA